MYAARGPLAGGFSDLHRIFRPTLNHLLIWRLVRESFRKHVFGYSVAIAAMMVMAGMTAASAWIMKDITDEFAIGKDINRIYMIAAAWRQYSSSRASRPSCRRCF